MTTFKLDTSGAVAPTAINPPRRLSGGLWHWPDLSPFVQGYVEAMFAELALVAHRTRPPCKLRDGQIWLLKCGRNGFSRVNLYVPSRGHGSTATNQQCAGLIRRGYLAERNGIVRITEAGTAALRTAEPLGFSDLAPETLARIMEDCGRFKADGYGWADDDATDGALLWSTQQAGEWADVGFPPLTLYLGDDGRVHLREGGQ